MTSPYAGLLKVSLPPKDELPAPESVNFSFIAWAGTDVQIYLGYTDLAASHQAQAKGRGATPEITSRIFMSITGFVELKKNVEEIAQQMRAAGIQV
jgi:hypothetical protein